MSETQAHSVLGASSMYRWMECPGSVRLCRSAPPQPDSPAAKEGTRVHSLGELLLRGDLPANEFQLLDEQTKSSIQLYCNTVMDDYLGKGWPSKSAANGDKLFIEHRFDLSSVYPGCFGTTDAAVWKARERLLIVYDYKNGVGVVEAEGNSQLLYYGLGALITLKLPAKHVEVVIVQPRAKHKAGAVRRWRVGALQMLDFEAELLEACQRTEDPNAPLVTGRHCFFCAAKGFCPVRHQQRQEDAADEFSALPADDSEDDVDPLS